MTTKHTPGPWHIKTAVSGNHFVYSEKSCQSDDKIAGISGVYPDSETAMANARLIAACPIMADYVIKQALAGDKDAQVIAKSFGWTPA